jgi:preprotein translocase subunit SecB
MTDAAPNGTADGQGAAQQPPIVVNAQYIKDLSFENPNPLQTLASQQQPRGELQVNVSARSVAPNSYEVVLHVRSEASVEGLSAFVMELEYAGVFTLNGIPQEHVHPVLMIEGPRLLFPFARQIVANTTREGGFMPMMLPPIDFAALYQQQQSAPPQPRPAGEGPQTA